MTRILVGGYILLVMILCWNAIYTFDCKVKSHIAEAPKGVKLVKNSSPPKTESCIPSSGYSKGLRKEFYHKPAMSV